MVENEKEEDEEEGVEKERKGVELICAATVALHTSGGQR